MPDPKLEIILAAKDVTGRALTKFQGRVQAITKSLFSFRGALGALTGAGGIGVLVDRSIDAADAIAKTADKLGISTKLLQEYRYAAERSGVATKTFDTAMRVFTRRLGEAAQEKGELRDVLRQYNIAVRDAAGRTRSAHDVFRQFADVIQQTRDPAERLRIVVKAFESEGSDLVNMLRQGSSGLDDFAARAQKLGIILEDDLLRGAEDVRDALDDVGQIIKTSFSRVVLENVDSITAAVEKLANALGTIAQYSGLRSVLTTFGQGLKLSLQGEIDFDKFKRAGFLERQRMVDEALARRQPTVVRKKMPPPPTAPGMELPPETPTAAARGRMARRDREKAVQESFEAMSAFEYSRFRQHEVLVRDSQKAYEKMTQHVRDYGSNVEDTYKSIDSRISTSFDHASEALADFVTRGKFRIRSFANSLISDLLRIQTRMALTGLFDFLPGLFAGRGPGTSVHRHGGGPSFGVGMPGIQYHSGGHIGEPIAGIGLQSGRSYEFAANETVLPDGQTGRVQVVINNFSGINAEKMERTSAGGMRQIVVTIPDVANNVIKGGMIDKAIQMRYNLQPAGKPI